jgi:ribosomal protein L37E
MAETKDGSAAVHRCPRCDAPIYEDEGTCHYCKWGQPARVRTFDWLYVSVAGAVCITLALVAAVH